MWVSLISGIGRMTAGAIVGPRESGAWATGRTLVGLHKTGNMKTSHSSWLILCVQRRVFSAVGDIVVQLLLIPVLLFPWRILELDVEFHSIVGFCLDPFRT